MKKIPLVFDLAVIFVTASVFFACVFGFYLSDVPALILSITLGLLLALISVKLLLARVESTEKQNENKKKLSQIAFQLDFMQSADVKNIFALAFKAKGKTVIKERKYLVLPEDNTAVLLKFGFEKVTKADVVRAYNLAGYEKTVIISSDFSPELISFAERFGKKIILKDVNYAYSLLSETDNLPKITFPYHERSVKLKDTLSRLNNKKYAKKFFLFGVGFTFFSLFSLVKIYYLTVAGIFLTFSLFLKLFGKSPENEQG